MRSGVLLVWTGSIYYRSVSVHALSLSLFPSLFCTCGTCKQFVTLKLRTVSLSTLPRRPHRLGPSACLVDYVGFNYNLWHTCHKDDDGPGERGPSSLTPLGSCLILVSWYFDHLAQLIITTHFNV